MCTYNNNATKWLKNTAILNPCRWPALAFTGAVTVSSFFSFFPMAYVPKHPTRPKSAVCSESLICLYAKVSNRQSLLCTLKKCSLIHQALHYSFSFGKAKRGMHSVLLFGEEIVYFFFFFGFFVCGL